MNTAVLGGAGIVRETQPAGEDYLLDRDLGTDFLNIGTKVYYFDLKANESGVFLKIVEKRGEHRSNIIVPADRIAEFLRKLGEVAARALELAGRGDHVEDTDGG